MNLRQGQEVEIVHIVSGERRKLPFLGKQAKTQAIELQAPFHLVMRFDRVDGGGLREDKDWMITDEFVVSMGGTRHAYPKRYLDHHEVVAQGRGEAPLPQPKPPTRPRAIHPKQTAMAWGEPGAAIKR